MEGLPTNELAIQRLASQQLVNSAVASVAQVVQWMGAMQAQDYDMAKWAVGVRLPGSTEALVEEALNRGDILRTHLLRPTWHFVAATDIDWLLDLTAPQIQRLNAGRNRQLGLDETILRRSNAVIEQALDGHNHLTRDELMERLQAVGIRTDEFRSAHLMMEAELSGLVCSGPRRGRQFTYALLRERVPERVSLPRNEALAELAGRYFTSHGPATLKDFAWWSGLTLTDCKRAVEGAKSSLQSITADGRMYWLSPDSPNASPLPEAIHLLPAFDEFMVSYCDRSASINPALVTQAVTANGIFKPIIVVNGQVVGLWKRSLKPTCVTVDLTFFFPLPRDLTERIRERASHYARYVQTSLVIVA